LFAGSVRQTKLAIRQLFGVVYRIVSYRILWSVYKHQSECYTHLMNGWRGRHRSDSIGCCPCSSKRDVASCTKQRDHHTHSLLTQITNRWPPSRNDVFGHNIVVTLYRARGYYSGGYAVFICIMQPATEANLASWPQSDGKWVLVNGQCSATGKVTAAVMS